VAIHGVLRTALFDTDHYDVLVVVLVGFYLDVGFGVGVGHDFLVSGQNFPLPFRHKFFITNLINIVRIDKFRILVFLALHHTNIQIRGPVFNRWLFTGERNNTQRFRNRNAINMGVHKLFCFHFHIFGTYEICQIGLF